MDYLVFMDIAFVVVYGAILGLVAQYVGVASDRYHAVVPGAIAIIFGTLLWSGLTWLGMSNEEVWIWLIVMLSMPAAMWFGANRLAAHRSK